MRSPRSDKTNGSVAWSCDAWLTWEFFFRLMNSCLAGASPHSTLKLKIPKANTLDEADCAARCITFAWRGTARAMASHESSLARDASPAVELEAKQNRAYSSRTSIFRGFASSALGSCKVNTHCLSSTDILNWSTLVQLELAEKFDQLVFTANRFAPPVVWVGFARIVSRLVK